MDLQLHGKRALVTGSSSGIGAAIARTLASEGTTVAVHGRVAARARQIANEIGGSAIAIVGDLSTDEGAQQVAERALHEFGAVDILVSNAGTFRNGSWMDFSANDWLGTYNNNVVSMVRIIHALAPQMKKLGWGRMIPIGSRAATRPRSRMPDYSASKAAILNLTVSLAKELAPFRITVNTVSPGIILTREVEERFRQLARERGWGEDWRTIENNIVREWEYDPTVRLGLPEDVAK